jgi:Tol biopolymer transport system component
MISPSPASSSPLSLLSLVIPLAITTVVSFAQSFPIAIAPDGFPSPSTECLGPSYAPRISSDGRFVVFLSEANHLADQDVNQGPDVFLKDRLTGELRVISHNSTRTGTGDRPSFNPQISADGRWILFESRSSNLVPQDTNGASDVFLHDALEQSTHLVSRRLNANSSGSGSSQNAILCRDGRFIAYESLAPDLSTVPDTNGVHDIFLYDHHSRSNHLVSLDATGLASANAESGSPAISADGRYLAFETRATNATPNPAHEQGSWNVIRHDRSNASNTLISVAHLANEGASAPARLPVISDLGHRVAFASPAPNLAPEILRHTLFVRDLDTSTLRIASAVQDPHTSTSPSYHLWTEPPTMTPDGRFIAYTSTTNLYLFDLTQDTVEIVSVASDGIAGANGICRSPRLSDDGRFVAFLSTASNLVDHPVNGDFLAYLRDRTTGITTLVSQNFTGTSSGDVANLDLSPDGQWIVFDSPSPRLVPDDHNQATDVFVWSASSKTLERISSGAHPFQPGTPTGSTVLGPHALSADGRWILYSRHQPVIDGQAPQDSPSTFLTDLVTGQHDRLHLTPDGTPSSIAIQLPVALSPNARHVAFVSEATDLVGEIPETGTHLFVRNLEQAITRRVPLSTRAPSLSNTRPFNFCFTGDARHLLHENLARAGTSLRPQIYAFDLESEINHLVSKRHDNGEPTQGTSYVLSAPRLHGRVVFVSDARDLVPEGQPGLFLYDLNTRSNDRIPSVTSLTVSSYGNRADRSSLDVSDDGRYLAFVRRQLNTSALLRIDLHDDSIVNLGPNRTRPSISADGQRMAYELRETESHTQIRSWDATLSIERLISRRWNSEDPANAECTQPALTPDGQHLYFRSRATDLLASPTTAVENLYRYDFATDSIHLVTVPSLGQVPSGNQMTGRPRLSANGRTLLFESFADNLLPADANRSIDLFAIRRGSVDTDDDRMDDDWEMAFFGSLSRDGTLDNDGDGMSDLDEFLTGTNPADGSRFLRATLLHNLGSGTRWVIWTSAPGRLYQVRYLDQLKTTNWQPLGHPVRAVSDQTSLEDNTQPQPSARYYRVQWIE